MTFLDLGIGGKALISRKKDLGLFCSVDPDLFLFCDEYYNIGFFFNHSCGERECMNAKKRMKS